MLSDNFIGKPNFKSHKFNIEFVAFLFSINSAATNGIFCRNNNFSQNNFVFYKYLTLQNISFFKLAI